MAKIIIDWSERDKTAVIFSDFLENIRSSISVINENKRRVAKTRPACARYMEDFHCPISKTGKFDIGLYRDIYQTIKKSNLNYEIVTSDLLLEKLKCPFKWKDDYKIYESGVILRDYQLEGIKRAIKIGNGIVIIGTAGGKTLLMATLIKTILAYEKNKSALIIIPSNILDQTYKEYLNFGISENEMGVWGNRSKELEKKKIILASPDILRSKLVSFTALTPKNRFIWGSDEKKRDSNTSNESYDQYLKNFTEKEKKRKKEWVSHRKRILKLLSDVDVIMIDEVHGLRDKNKLNKVIDLFPTRKRFGFTGTLPDDVKDRWNIIGKIGPIILNINSFKLREKKYISDVKIQILRVNYIEPPRVKIDINDPTGAYDEECAFIFKNKFRNNIISHLAAKAEKNVLIMVDRIDHGEELVNSMKGVKNKKVFFIRGSMEMEDRETIRGIMEVEDSVICIAISKIFSTGINIKNLHYIIFAQGGKAKITLIQSIGRGLRLHEDKKRLTIIDIADNTHYGERHLSERIEHYENEKIDYSIKELYERKI